MKKTITFCNVWAMFARDRVGSQIKGLESKFYKILQICKKILVPTFSSFAAINQKGYFRKNLIGFSSLAAFLDITSKFYRLPDGEYNAESIGINFKFQK